ncbi:hypothetical protein CR513_10099, partial [Mucuna pruriens]
MFGGLAVVVVALELSKSNKDQVNTSTIFNSFKNNYLLFYSLMMVGDWLQGPYVYYLYSTYGYRKREIGNPYENKDLLTQFRVCCHGSMYTFVFLWTPALSPNDEKLVHPPPTHLQRYRESPSLVSKGFWLPTPPQPLKTL